MNNNSIQRFKSSAKGLWWFTFFASATLYLATCQHGVCWQDSGMFQWRVLHADYSGDLGLALAHPWYIAAGQLLKIIPAGSFTARLNFFSGLGMAVALATIAVVVFSLTGRRWIGLTVAAMLAVTHTVWWLSTIAEVYTWSAAGLAVELWLLVHLLHNPRWLTLAGIAFISGLNVCNHNMALLPLPVYAAVAIVLVNRGRLPVWSLLASGLLYILGAGPYFFMAAELYFKTGSLSAAINSALFGNRFISDVLNTSTSWNYMRENAALIAMNFVNVLLPLAIIGLINLRHRIGNIGAAALTSITIIELLFVVRYSVPDQFTFFIPSLVMIAMLSGIGLAVLADTSPQWKLIVITASLLSIAMPPLFYANASSLANLLKINTHRTRELPFRDEARYWLVPWKHNERSAELFAAAAFKQASPDGIIIPDSTSLYPLLLVQHRDDIGHEVTIQFSGQPLPPYKQNPSAFRTVLGNRPLYVTTIAPGYIPTSLLQDAKFAKEKDEVLYRVILDIHSVP